MQRDTIITAMGNVFKQWFHKRNIIIISERKVKHIPIGGPMQFAVMMLLISGVCWASYSTGSFMAARSVLKEQSQTLRSVASARIETNFTSMFPTSPIMTMGAEAAHDDPMTASLSDPMFTLAALDHTKLFARIAFLEYKVTELRNTNEAIIQRVRDKTTSRIDDLESIIEQTGLKVEDLKRQATDKPAKGRRTSRNTDSSKSEGGPYIPAGPIALTSKEYQLFNNLDELAVLSQIVDTLPLGYPIKNAEEQSQYGHRIDPFNGHLAFHAGLDLAGPSGAKIFSTADGKVVAAHVDGGYGNVVDIDHGFGIMTRYGHLSKILVKDGQIVKKGDAIGIQGSTGRSTGPHLHYEVRYHDQPMNPKNFLNAGNYVSEE